MTKTPEIAGATLLIVDDIPANLAVVVEFLEDKGFRVAVAQDGEEALRRVECVNIDLILLDVMMPGIDGFETCRRLKADPATRDIPVIFMTALAETENKLIGFEAGGVDYVTKPFQLDEVLARVNTHLTLRALQVQLAMQNTRLHLAYEELTGINERLEVAQSQLVQSEKMASIGLLAAGIAHEINNPLGFVGSNLENLADYAASLFKIVDAYEAAGPVLATSAPQLLEAVRKTRQDADLDFIRQDTTNLIDESRDGLARVKKIVQDLKDFSHVGAAEWQLADLNKGLDSTLNIVWNELKYKASVVKNYSALPAVECLPCELNQVFMNILVNAGHAISGRGEIRIGTGCEGDQVWVEIADTGTGIAPENAKRIFDPFFTTKPVGKGTGLGLSLSYATVRKHGGRIDVNSAPGEGTIFRIWLPIRQAGHASSDECGAADRGQL